MTKDHQRSEALSTEVATAPGCRARSAPAAVFHFDEITADSRAVLANGSDHPRLRIVGRREDRARDLIPGDSRLALLGLEQEFLRGRQPAGQLAIELRAVGAVDVRLAERARSRESRHPTGRSAAIPDAHRHGGSQR